MTDGSTSRVFADAAALRAALRADLVAAMKSRRPEAVSALRTAIAAIDNAEAVASEGSPGDVGTEHVAGARAGVGSTEVVRRELSLDDVLSVLRDEVSTRLSEADGYERHGRVDAAERLRSEAGVLRSYVTA